MELLISRIIYTNQSLVCPLNLPFNFKDSNKINKLEYDFYFIYKFVGHNLWDVIEFKKSTHAAWQRAPMYNVFIQYIERDVLL